MDDDKDKAGVLPGGDANKRTPPTIDLAASEVTESPRAPETHEPAPDHSEQVAEKTAEPSAESVNASSRRPSRLASIFLAALAGAVAAVLVIGAATLADWPSRPAPEAIAPLTDN